jgi:Ca2+-binding RTX toxin-like protein
MRGKLVLLVIAGAAALVAAPAALAVENFAIRYEVSEETNLRTLTVKGDENANQMTVACLGGLVAVDGVPIAKANDPSQKLPCGAALGTAPVPGPQAITLLGEGGNDRIDTTGVTAAAGFTKLVGVHGTMEVHLYGGPGADTLVGGPLGERFNEDGEEAPGGGDTIEAGAGNDEIAGTAGPDKILAGPGNDQIKPGAGADLVRGGPGSDAIDGEGFDRSPDRYYGEGGPDIMFGGAGNDYLNGGPGNDSMHGYLGNDTLVGGPGNDQLWGEGGNDVLLGGPGKDYLGGGPGRNRLVQ